MAKAEFKKKKTSRYLNKNLCCAETRTLRKIHQNYLEIMKCDAEK
jgi:hypothetical protein